MTNNFVFETDLAAKKIHIVREFNSPIEKVWRAWTEPVLLEKWIVLKHWTAETKTMDLSVGGIWLYAMINSKAEKHWVYAKFTAIEKEKLISSIGMFCDTEGNPLPDGPKTYRDTTFSSIDGNRTKVDMVIAFEEESILTMFVNGGFKEGMETTLDILDELLASK